MDKVKAFYCLTKDCIIIKFEKPLPLKGEKGKKLEQIIRKTLIQKGIQVMNWMPLIFSPLLPKIDGEFTIEVSSIITPSWKLLKEKILNELNK